MIVKFYTPKTNDVKGLLIQKNNDTFYSYVFDMNIEEVEFGMTNPKFIDDTLTGLLTQFCSYYRNSFITIKTSPVIGDSDFKKELLEALDKLNIK